jgi:sec-independent protein translocase protein TatA
MGELFQPTHLLIIGVVLLLLFGGRKLPELGKGLGEGLRGFKEGMKGIDSEPDKTTKPGETAHAVTPKPGDDLKPPTV